eukprot:TRINITY_DN14255_c0_g1_i1.p1 TRINITY_DN14255_c0_g1~~TRINITY_DN14255_c0_g1_i1.p1  ORF type:complete len:528 (+),score=67.62 TRINITY_DN14255_c0_g1_i1:301-1884(+)
MLRSLATCWAMCLAQSSSSDVASRSTDQRSPAGQDVATATAPSCAEDDDACSDRPIAPSSFLQVEAQLAMISGKLGLHQLSSSVVSSNVSDFKWQNLMNPKDCVSGKSAQDAQACHLENLDTLASAHFSAFPASSVTLDDFEDAFKAIDRAGIAASECCVIQILNNTVWEIGTCKAQIKVLSTVLQHATSLPDVGSIPDVEMHACKVDQTPLLLPANGVRVPFLAPSSVPEARGHIIPVPLNERRGLSSQTFPPDMSGYHAICHGRAAFDSTDFGKMIAGERQCLPQSATPWSRKNNVAFFRGSVYADAENCTECKCRTDDGLCHDCSPGCRLHNYGRSCARPRSRTICSRPDLFAGLEGREEFNVGTTGDFVDECMWELNKYLLVIGNNIGWADRVQDSLFKTSATILADSGAYEWFYPLMIEGLHFIRADPTVESISDVVRTAIGRDDKDMTQRANAFARLVFGIDNVARYTAMVAKAYGRVQAYKPSRRVPASRPCDRYDSEMKAQVERYVERMLKAASSRHPQ